MNPDLLRDQLTQLHAELGQMKQVDARSNQLLIEVQKDIQRLLELEHAAASAAGRPPPATAARSLSDRLEKVAVQFEADHPTLAASSRRLIDLLGKAGL